MRRIYSISIAGLFILNSIAGICILCFHHYRMEVTIASIIRNENYSGNLHQLEFSNKEADDLIWFKDGREFIHHGQMYDVVRTDVKDDGRVIYHCIKDEKENEIYNSIAYDVSHSSSGPSHDRHLLLQFFRLLSNPVIIPVSVMIHEQPVSQNALFSYSEASRAVYLSVASEPPDVI